MARWLLPIALFAVALWLRLYRLDVQPLWLDEGRTWLEVTHSHLGTLIVNLLRPTEAYPLFHLILKPVTRLLGDSEWALRLPSAVAGALAVPAIYALGRELRGSMLGLGAAALLLLSPFAIWQAQDAKAYSLTLLAVILLALTLARAQRLNTRAAWLVFAAVALLAPFAHRLLVFSLIGAAVAWAVHAGGRETGRPGDVETRRRGDTETWRHGDVETRSYRPWSVVHGLWSIVRGPWSSVRRPSSVVPRPSSLVRRPSSLVLLGAIGLGLALVAAMAWSLRAQNAGGQFASVGPARALWLTFGQFAAGQWPGAVPRLWLFPFALLTLLGGARLIHDAWRHRSRGASIVLALGVVPTLLFSLLLTMQPLYESRYFTIVFPFWLLAMAWALPEASGIRGQGSGVGRFGDQGLDHGTPVQNPTAAWRLAGSMLAVILIVGALLAQQRALYLPGMGIWSGATVKEDMRGAVRKLAEHVHPDDLVIVHPDTILPLYHYYASRVTFQPLPAPKVYDKLGRTTYGLRELDIEIRQDLTSAKRAWLLIAPEHAKIVDPPRVEGDTLGLVGLAFQYGDRNRRIMCGDLNSDQSYAGFVGVLLYCNNIPDIRGQIPQPDVPVEAIFDGRLKLRGYTITPFATGTRPGGTLPLSLFWQPLESLAGTDYIVFVHLTRPDDPTPLTQIDGRPMEEGQRTSMWTKPGVLLHDDRALKLPADLTPGRYVLRLGLYRAEDGARLPITSATQPVADDSLILGAIEVEPADGGAASR